MTDEEMVYYLKRADATVGQKCKTKTAEAIEKALKMLKQQPRENCISREAAIEAVEKWFELVGIRSDICIDGLISLPSVTPQPKVGKWIRKWCEWQQYLECSECEYETGLGCDTNYCPNCGAKMETYTNE